MSQDTIRFADRPTASGHVIKHVTLNAPRALNALSIDMVEQLLPALDTWEADANVVGIFLEGAGDKAFCAGGDIVQSYHCMVAGDYATADDYFTREYHLDYRLHTLQTPLITWADGITMGGGLGLAVAGSHRLTTENTLMAMPEITIGLFPDVGASWFLNRMPGRLGLFLGLTGARLNAGDALFTGLADRFVPADSRAELLAQLDQAMDWSQPHRTINRILRQLQQNSTIKVPAAPTRQHFDAINTLLDADDTSEIIDRIQQAELTDPWLVKAQQTLAAGCPVTACLIAEQIRRGRYLSLADCHRMEWIMASQCLRHPDFQEGVRALLIDKDGQPSWQFKRVAEVPADYIAEHFRSPRPGDHPLDARLSD